MRKYAALTFSLLAAALLLAASPSKADEFTFTFSGGGVTATGILNAVVSGLADDSLLVTSGSLNVTSSSDANASVGTYSLIPLGPAPTYSPSNLFIVDDLIYPSNDAASGVNPGISSNPSYLTNYGLLFGPPGTGNQDEINIWGNGGAYNYAFYSEAGGGYNIQNGGGGTFSLAPVPEPVSMLLMGTFLSLAGGFLSKKKRAV